MKKISYFFSLILLLINIGAIYSKPKLNIYHPLRINIDFSNIEKNNQNNNLISLLTEVGDILSKLIYSNNVKKLSINPKILSKCKTNISFKSFRSEDIDIIIYPLLYKMIKKYKIAFCEKNKNKMPSIIILKIKNNLNFSFDNEKEKYSLILNLLKMLTDCLGLDRDYLKKNKFFRNNFFETPYFLLYESAKSFNSVKKLYTLSGEKIPKKNISLNGNFYLSSWDKDFIVKDFRSETSDITGDISESSLNAFNDIEFYSIPKFDYEYIGKNNQCFRVDQKCLNESELKKYYLNYGINQEKNNEIVCYLSNSQNIKNNQCGIKYSYLIEEKMDFCPLISKKKYYKRKIINNKVLDLFYYNSQTLNLLKPSCKCKNPSQRTIYFKSFEREENLSNIYEIETITLNKKQNKFFVTYITRYESYYSYLVDLLNKNGIIRAYYFNNNQNLYIKKFEPEFFLKKSNNSNYFNQYQKLFQFLGNVEYFYKNLLNQNYKHMKSFFPKDYNYMPKTYEYPKDAEKIKNKFGKYKLNLKDLWIVKPTDLFNGIGIHIFKSLEQEEKNKFKEFIISKYLSNPHLIHKKKYDMRLYVLVTGFQPLRIYLYKEGLIRIASERYKLKINSLDNKYSHITNTAINFRSKKYKIPKNDSDEQSNKWNFHTYRNYLKKQNIDADLIFEKIKDIVIKTIISGQKKIVNTTKELNLDDINMFNLFGFDIFINNYLDPYLLEVNTRPSMEAFNKYDTIIKSKLLVDSLNIIGITLFSHDKEHKPFDKVLHYENKIQKRVDDALCELTRPRGDYELIFPLKNNINNYTKFFMKNKGKENNLFWKEIIKD